MHGGACHSSRICNWKLNGDVRNDDCGHMGVIIFLLSYGGGEMHITSELSSLEKSRQQEDSPIGEILTSLKIFSWLNLRKLKSLRITRRSVFVPRQLLRASHEPPIGKASEKPEGSLKELIHTGPNQPISLIFPLRDLGSSE